MPFTLLQIIVLGLVQGATELLPVSSSAHVIVIEKLMGIDPTSPEATFLLIMLHTGTMLAVLAYFWRSWARHYLTDTARATAVARQIVIATALTGFLGLLLKLVIEKLVLAGSASTEVESLFGKLPLIAGGLAAAGILILVSGGKRQDTAARDISGRTAVWMGLVQALCLPFRGFSRSGATISTALLLGAGREAAEEFSFALGFVVTPPLLAMELRRLVKFHATETEPHHLKHLLTPGVAGLVCSFIVGYFALKLLSRWLTAGNWRYFGYYCLGAAVVVAALAGAGF
jgi:undecaprenyl-diphosphatase